LCDTAGVSPAGVVQHFFSPNSIVIALEVRICCQHHIGWGLNPLFPDSEGESGMNVLFW